jgi:hypothetical protein
MLTFNSSSTQLSKLTACLRACYYSLLQQHIKWSLQHFNYWTALSDALLLTANDFVVSYELWARTTHRKHSSLHCCVTSSHRKQVPPLLRGAYVGRCLLGCCLATGCIPPLFCCCVLDRVYGAVAWQCVGQIRYIMVDFPISLSDLFLCTISGFLNG